MAIFKRLLGLIITIVSVLGLIIGIAGAVLLPRSFEQVQTQTGGALEQAVGSFDSAETTVITIRDTISEASAALETAEQTTVNLAFAITTTKPILDEAVVVVGENVPASIETVQTALPNLIVVAQTVDQALITLSEFGINESLGGNVVEIPDIELLGRSVELPDIQLPALPLNFNLGIEYNPETAFDQSLVGIEEDLDGIPESLRTLSSSLGDTSESIVVVGEDVALISGNINQINAQVSLLPGQIDGYLSAIDDVKTSVLDLETTINTQLSNVSTGLVVLLIWFALIQLAPLYLGVHLLLGRKLD